MRGLGQGRAAEDAALTAQRPLSISPALRRTSAGAPSSNGKTTDSDSVNRGSNPRGASISLSEHIVSMPQATAPPVQTPTFSVDGFEEGQGFRILVCAPAGEQRSYVVPTGTQQ